LQRGKSEFESTLTCLLAAARHQGSQLAKKIVNEYQKSNEKQTSYFYDKTAQCNGKTVVPKHYRES
jgi:hypothetical protein